MQIELGHGFFIDVEDGYNYTLKQRVTVTGENARGKKPKEENIGQEREKQHGYFTSIESALKKAVTLGLTECDEMKEAKRLIRDFNEAINSANKLTISIREKNSTREKKNHDK